MSEPSFYELSPIMEEVLASGGRLRMVPRGSSMRPFIRSGVDEIVVTAPSDRMKRGRIFLYRRQDGRLVLHRLVGKREDGLLFRGDNQLQKELIQSQQVIAELQSVNRGRYNIKTGSIRFMFYWFIALPRCILKIAFLRFTAVIHRIRT